MVVVMAIQKWWHYLFGHSFTVCTDQQALKFLLEQREVATDHYKWITKRIEYDFDIQYIPSLTNKAVDALSRMSPIVHN